MNNKNNNNDYHFTKNEHWEMCNKILNSVRKVAGLPLVDPAMNLYNKKQRRNTHMKDKLSIFEVASRNRYRFTYKNKYISTEELWNLSIKDLLDILVKTREERDDVIFEKQSLVKHIKMEQLDIKCEIIIHIMAKLLEKN